MHSLDQLNSEKDADASLWGKVLGAGETLFKNVPLGARFVFRRDDAEKPYAVLIRTAHGYRHEIGGRQFKTGQRTACHVIA